MNSLKRILLPIILGLITSFVFYSFSTFTFKVVFWGTWLFTSIGYFVLLLLFNKFDGDKFIGIILAVS
ncbi:MAG TPA: hypothetical protein VK856_11275, partial [Anaerolineaceae bacterium]|nr:hypothetical protein [Anaerolineaceae bacterium]